MEYSTRNAISPNSFSLSLLMQIVTGGSIFWAVLVVNPPLAIIGAVLSTPAIIRTGWVAEQLRVEHLPFQWHTRFFVFVRSLFFVCVVALLSAVAFVSVCVICGIGGFAFGKVMGSYDNSAMDMAAVGSVSGVIWGMGVSAIVAMFLLTRYWRPSWPFER